jgi:hypothetical protein
MRDSSKGMIEILDSENQNDLYFSTIKLLRNDINLKLRFGITERDYYYIKNIVSFRPFENTGVSSYKYFFSGSYSKNSPTEGLATISVRVEQQKNSKQYGFQVSTAFVANLLWFDKVNDKAVLEAFVIPSRGDKSAG